jgi:hypothetical protein
MVIQKLINAFLIIVSSFSWFTLLCSLSIKMMALRVSLEPGAQPIPELHTAALTAFLLGLGGTLLVHLIYYLKKTRIRSLWIGNLVATILYVPVFLFTLLLMV